MLGVDQIAGSGKLSDEYVIKNLGVKYTPGHTLDRFCFTWKVQE